MTNRDINEVGKRVRTTEPSIQWYCGKKNFTAYTVHLKCKIIIELKWTILSGYGRGLF